MEGDNLERELAYHRNVAMKALHNMYPIPNYILKRYKKSQNWRIFPKEGIFHFIQEYAKKKGHIAICEFGCGSAEISCQIAYIVRNATVLGFDISPELIEVAKKRANINNLQNSTKFIVADAEEKPFQCKQFDVVLALAIIHHVDIKKVIPNLLEMLRPGGMIIIKEPIAFSRPLQKIRDLTPIKKDVSPDERQLCKSEVSYLLSVIENPKCFYYKYLGRLERVFSNRNKIDKGHLITKFILTCLFRLDNLLFTVLPFFRKYAGMILIIGHKPVRSL